MTTVSVIIPTWNRANTIKKAVLSALNQTYPITEILVCDDGSTDNTKQVISELNSEKVKWLEGDHAGLASVPRNRAIRESKAEWLSFLDSDDEWMPEKIERQLATAEKYKINAVCSNAFRIVPNNSIADPYFAFPEGKISFEQLIKCNYVICSSVFVKSNLFETVIGFPESGELKVGEDYALWLRVATQTDFAYVAEPLLNYSDDPEQSIRKNHIEERVLRKRVITDLLDWMELSPVIKSGKYYKIAKQELKKAKRMNNEGIFSFLQRKR